MTDQQTNRLAASAALAAADDVRQFASLRSDVPSFMVMDVMRAALEAENAGRHIIHMEVGQPGTPAPRVARDVAAHALQHDTLGYTMALGNDALRERIARHYADQHGLSIAPQRIAVTAGSSAAFVLTFLSLFDAGDIVALPSPGYPCYRHILSALGQRSVLLETGPSNDWMTDPDDVLRAIRRDGIKGLLIASPANPTGTMISPERLRALTDVCQQHGVRFISDEIYHGLTYTRPADTALAFSDDAIVINSFSKYFSMTGWRMGWMVVPQQLIRSVERLTQNLYISPPSIAQVAALGAFDARDELEANRDVYAANRELLLAELPKAGFTRFAPADGAFYLYCNVGEFLGGTGAQDAATLARTLLDEAGVALTPGNDFDAERGGQFLRFSYAGTTADMAEAARRLQLWSRSKA